MSKMRRKAKGNAVGIDRITPPSQGAAFGLITDSLRVAARNLYRGSSAIDRQNRTLDETGAVGCQEHDCLGNLLRRGRTPGRRLRRELLQRVAHCRGAIGAGRSGTDRIHADALPLQMSASCTPYECIRP
jgi:hypothetical protein